MPTSKPRKKATPKRNPQARRDPNRAVPKKSVVPKVESIKDVPGGPRVTRDPARPLPDDQLYQAINLPEPASYDQVLVALSEFDPVIQEVMLAQRLSAMPHPGDPENGMPVHIERMARGPWAHHLRKLGIFVLPELATHELVAPDRASGAMVNHTAMTARKIDRDDLWEMARQAKPELAHMVDTADTPEKKQAAAKKLLTGLPIEIRIAMQRLMATSPDEMEPV
jgi:hypothetical protein